MARIVYKFPLILLLLFMLSQCAVNVQKNSNDIKEPVEWSKNLSIYEVNIRQYTKEGTFSAFKAHLPRLKKLGVGILWLMPINPIGVKERKGTLGSYYAVKDYKAVNPEFGTKEEFDDLVKEIHKQGMYVILDWVANHTAWDHQWTETHPEYYKKDSAGNFTAPVEDWSDVIALDYDSDGLRESMISALEYWVREFDIDGYRCDVASMVPTDFWNDARAKLDEIKPVFMLAEAEETDLHEQAFDMTYAWDLHHSINQVAKGEENADEFFNVFEKHRKEYGNSAYRMNFTSNHDENSWNGTVKERLDRGAEVMAALTYTLDGMPLIYSGQEAGLDKRLLFFERDPIDWKDSKYFDLYKKLNELKKQNQALWNGDYGSPLERITTSDDANVLMFSRIKENDAVIMISNLSNEMKTFTISWELPEGNFMNYFTGKDFLLNKNDKLSMDGWDYIILVKK